MAEKRVQCRLAAILAADVVGYSRMVGADEHWIRIETLRRRMVCSLSALAAGGRQI
jgi:hypothetical protein